MARNEEPSAETIVSTSMRIEGELKSNGNIRIDGVISGKVHTSQDLLVGPNAQIDADVIASNAVIAGTVNGNINIKGTLQLMDSAKVVGNISCAKLSIQEGAYFSGSSKMSEDKPEEEPEK